MLYTPDVSVVFRNDVDIVAVRISFLNLSWFSTECFCVVIVVSLQICLMYLSFMERHEWGVTFFVSISFQITFPPTLPRSPSLCACLEIWLRIASSSWAVYGKRVVVLSAIIELKREDQNWAEERHHDSVDKMKISYNRYKCFVFNARNEIGTYFNYWEIISASACQPPPICSPDRAPPRSMYE